MVRLSRSPSWTSGKATTDSKHSIPIADKLLAPKLTPAAASRVWARDITSIQTGNGWLYVVIVLYLVSGEIVGSAITLRMTADIVTDALTMACSAARQMRARSSTVLASSSTTLGNQSLLRRLNGTSSTPIA